MMEEKRYEPVHIGRSCCPVDWLERYLYHYLYKGFWMQAGQKFHWDGDPTGLGVAFKVLKYAKDNRLQVRLIVGDDDLHVYQASPAAFLEFTMNYRTFHNIEGVLLYVMRVTEFKIVAMDVRTIKDMICRNLP